MNIIPFNKPFLVGSEHSYIAKCFKNVHTSGNGAFAKKCERLLENIIGASKALLTTSCTHALEMTALLLDLKPEDEVILPSFTFPSTINAFILRGVRPIFADIRPDTLNIDETKIEKLITYRTKAIVVMHYAGVACEMDEILRIAKKYDLIVIEDNAHGIFGRYKGKYLGTLGLLSTQSFHESKNFSCGEGGALIINDEKYINRAEIIREKGTDRSLFFRGKIDKYTWVDVGSSYVLSDLLAAYLYAQLEIAEKIQSRRRIIWNHYKESLTLWAEENYVRLPFVPNGCEQSFHLFYLILPSEQERDNLMQYLKEQNIESVFHYQALHVSKMGLSFGSRIGDCPVTESIVGRILRLPFFYALTNDEQDYVIKKVKEYKIERAVQKNSVFAC